MASANRDESEREPVNDSENQFPETNDESTGESAEFIDEPTQPRRDRAAVLVDHLREAREAKGWSQEDLSDRTRISLHVVRSIENGDLDIVEVPYIRAFLKTYARAVGVPIDEVEDVFPEPKALVEEPLDDEDIHAIPIPAPSSFPTGLVLKIAGAILVLLLIWWIEPWSAFTRSSSSSDQSQEASQEAKEPPAAATDDSVSTDTDSETVRDVSTDLGDEPILRARRPAELPPAQTPIVTRATAEPTVSSGTLRITATDTAWVQILDAATEETIYDAIMSPGASRQWTIRDTVQITFGRRWAVTMAVNGDSVRVPGAANRNTVVFLLGPSGIFGQ